MAYKGAQNETYIRDCDIDEINELQDAANGNVRYRYNNNLLPIYLFSFLKKRKSLLRPMVKAAYFGIPRAVVKLRWHTIMSVTCVIIIRSRVKLQNSTLSLTVWIC